MSHCYCCDYSGDKATTVRPACVATRHVWAPLSKQTRARASVYIRLCLHISLHMSVCVVQCECEIMLPQWRREVYICTLYTCAKLNWCTDVDHKRTNTTMMNVNFWKTVEANAIEFKFGLRSHRQHTLMGEFRSGNLAIISIWHYFEQLAEIIKESVPAPTHRGAMKMVAWFMKFGLATTTEASDHSKTRMNEGCAFRHSVYLIRFPQIRSVINFSFTGTEPKSSIAILYMNIYLYICDCWRLKTFAGCQHCVMHMCSHR